MVLVAWTWATSVHFRNWNFLNLSPNLTLFTYMKHPPHITSPLKWHNDWHRMALWWMRSQTAEENIHRELSSAIVCCGPLMIPPSWNFPKLYSNFANFLQSFILIKGKHIQTHILYEKKGCSWRPHKWPHRLTPIGQVPFDPVSVDLTRKSSISKRQLFSVSWSLLSAHEKVPLIGGYMIILGVIFSTWG